MAILYVLGTPIGNLKDITYRAVEVLQQAEAVACEDTRQTAKLLNAYGIRKPLISVRARNESIAAEKVLQVLRAGGDVAYATDAGTPGVSDPGSVLARMAREEGFDVSPIPGPSAGAALVSVCGFGGKTYTFEGFLSPKQGRRRKRLEELLEREENFLIYESPYRIVKLLADLSDLSPEREILIGREMTKIHEEFFLGTAKEGYEEFQSRDKILGEFSVLVNGRKKS